jgi:hypothetical protein
VRLAGRVLPVAFACFEYDKLRKSQNVELPRFRGQ